MEELLNKLIPIVFAYRCEKNILISDKLGINKTITHDGYTFIPKEAITGIVCFGASFPFSGLDMNIDDLVDACNIIDQYKRKHNAVILKDMSDSDVYFKMKTFNDTNMPEFI